MVFLLINIGNYSLTFLPQQDGENFNFVHPKPSDTSKPSPPLLHGTRNGNGFEVIEYYVKIELFQNFHYLDGTTEIKFKTIEPLDILSFFLFTTLNVTKVYSSVNISWERDSWALNIMLNKTLAAQSTVNITIDYQGIIGYDSPQRWSHYIGSESIYLHNQYNTNASWFPWNGVAPVLIEVKAWEKLTVVCQGSLLNVVNFNGTSTYTWYIQTPRGPEVMLFAGIFNSYYTKFQGKNVSLYLFESEKSWSNYLMSEIVSILEYYSSSFSDLDIDRLVVLESAYDASRGYAADSFIIIHKQVFKEGVNSVFQVLTHEISHQWWGYLIKPMFDETAGRWLHEGFAHYSSALYENHTNNSKRLLNLWMDNYIGLVNGDLYLFSLSLEYKQYLQHDGPIDIELIRLFEIYGISVSSEATLEKIQEKLWEIEDSEDHYDVYDTGSELKIFGPVEETPIATTGFEGTGAEHIVYDKGAIVLHMLNYLVGDDVFFDILSTYCSNFAYKIVTLQDFINVSENVSHEELDWFFDQWIYSTKHLDYSIKEVTEKKNGNEYKTEVTIERLGEIMMPVDLTFYLKDNETITMTKVWDGAGNSTKISITTQVEILEVELDSEQWLLDINRTNNYSQVTLSSEDNLTTLLIMISIVLVVIGSITVIFIKKYKS